MFARALFLTGLAIVTIRRIISLKKKSNTKIHEPAAEEEMPESLAEAPEEVTANITGSNSAEAGYSTTFTETTVTAVTRETSIITDGDDSRLDSLGEATSALKSIDAVSIDADATSKPSEKLTIGEVTPRSNSFKKLTESMKRTLSGSRKSMTPRSV